MNTFSLMFHTCCWGRKRVVKRRRKRENKGKSHLSDCPTVFITTNTAFDLNAQLIKKKSIFKI